MYGRKAEPAGREQLKVMYKQAFAKKILPVGSQKKEFDGVSADGSVVAMIKAFLARFDCSSEPQKKTRLERCIADCAWLNAYSSAKIRVLLLSPDYVHGFRATLKDLLRKLKLCLLMHPAT